MFHTGESIKCHVTAMPWGVTGKQYPKSEERKRAAEQSWQEYECERQKDKVRERQTKEAK